MAAVAVARQDAHASPGTGETDEACGRGRPRHPWDAFFDAPVPLKEESGAERGNLPPRRFGQRSRDVPWCDDERLSHALGRVLRYHTEDAGLTPDEEGFVALTELLALPDFQGVSDEEIMHVASSSVGARGQRFEVRHAASGDSDVDVAGVHIRALYKHPKDGPGRSGDFRRDSYRSFAPRGGYGFRCGADGRRGGFSTLSVDDHVGADAPRRTDIEGGRVTFSTTACSAEVATALPVDDSAEVVTALPVDEMQERISEVDEAAAAPPIDEKWERYNEPSTQRVWFWNEATEEVFYADDAQAEGWERFEDSTGAPWWWHEASGRHFYEED